MSARFDENPAMTLQDIKDTKRYGRTDGRTHTWTDGQRENSIPTTNKVCGGYNYLVVLHSRGDILVFHYCLKPYHKDKREKKIMFYCFIPVTQHKQINQENL